MEFKHDFESNKPVIGSIDYFATVTIRTPAWEKVLETTSLKTAPLNGTSRHIKEEHMIEIDKFWETVRTFDKETGTNTNEFNITYRYFVYVQAQSGPNKINEKITPSVDLAVKPRSGAGDVITIGNQDYTRPGSVVKKEAVQIISIFGIYRYQYRYLSIAASSITIVVFTFLTRSIVKTGPKKEKSIIDLVKPYREVVAEATEPIYRRGGIVITVNNLDDLAKVSDNLAKPILHTKSGRTHTFYLYDGPNRYEYNIDGTQ
ncbi:MAG: DUF5305 family protein [Nitrososphaeria archaeon]